MKIYHTETQEDYDALMGELEEQGCKWLSGRKPTEAKYHWFCYEEKTCVRVSFGILTKFNFRHYKEEYPNIPVIKYKVKADEKMKFTKDNVYKLFSQYRKTRNYTLNDLQDEILNLDDTPEKVFVPKFVAGFYEECENATLLFLITQLEATNSRSELGKWYRSCSGRHRNGRANAQKVIAKMTLYGYTIEKEPQYIVSIMDLDNDRIILMKNRLGYSFELESENDGHQEIHFTEQQIKECNELYWAFAIPVEGKE